MLIDLNENYIRVFVSKFAVRGCGFSFKLINI